MNLSCFSLFVTKKLYVLVVLYYATKIMGEKNNSNYAGHKFPSKYLEAESVLPTKSDFECYLGDLRRSIQYFGRYPNSTDVNTALCLYLTKSLLKRTLLDNRSKLQRNHIKYLSEIINNAENILSHYTYGITLYNDWIDSEFRVSKLFTNDVSLVQSIGKFNENRLNKWIYNYENFNDYMEEIDEATLPKEKYGQLINSALAGYHINIKDSDWCISRVAYNPEPISLSAMRPCRPEAFCNHHLDSNPSIGYTLSHKMLNMLFRVSMRRCYLTSEAEDLARMDQLCAAMYRETVYIARRGFFARDLFLEHIALCGIMGYEEFHGRHWFNKVSSWLNDAGCIKEFPNFELNRTKAMLKNNVSAETRSNILKWRCSVMHSLCDDHPSGIFMIVMSHAIRYAAHVLPSTL